MGSLFRTDTASNYLKRQNSVTNRALSSTKATLNPKAAIAPLKSVQGSLGSLPPIPMPSIPGIHSASDAYRMGIEQNGDVNLSRTPFTQGWLDTLGRDKLTSDSSFGQLLSQLAPGYGKLSTERQRALELEKRKATGDLRAQLAKRRVLGASFAQDQEASLAAEYDRMKDQARAESIVSELQQTQQVITQRADTALKYTQQALQQIQFEGSTQAGLTETQAGLQKGLMETRATILQTAQNNMLKLKDLQVDVAKMIASITSASQIANAEVRSGLFQQMSGSLAGYAGIESQEKAGLGNFLGSVLGTAVGFAGSGGLGGGASTGRSLTSGGFMPATSSVTPIGATPFK